MFDLICITYGQIGPKLENNMVNRHLNYNLVKSFNPNDKAYQNIGTGYCQLVQNQLFSNINAKMANNQENLISITIVNQILHGKHFVSDDERLDEFQLIRPLSIAGSNCRDILS